MSAILPPHIKTPEQIREALEAHLSRSEQPGYQVTERDLHELMELNSMYADYLKWVEENGVPQ